MSWISLGHATQAELESLVSKTTFADIFETATPSNATCPEGFTSISKRDNALGSSCLKLKPGMETAASRFESRRYLAMLGGTVVSREFRHPHQQK